MADDVHKAKVTLTHTKRERAEKAAEYWSSVIRVGEQSETGKAIQRESLRQSERQGMRQKPG